MSPYDTCLATDECGCNACLIGRVNRAHANAAAAILIEVLEAMDTNVHAYVINSHMFPGPEWVDGAMHVTQQVKNIIKEEPEDDSCKKPLLCRCEDCQFEDMYQEPGAASGMVRLANVLKALSGSDEHPTTDQIAGWLEIALRAGRMFTTPLLAGTDYAKGYNNAVSVVIGVEYEN